MMEHGSRDTNLTELLPNMERNILAGMSLLNARVCSEGSYDEAEEWLKTTHPAGTTGNWMKRDSGNFAPFKCDEYPERTHYMFSC